MSQKTLMGLQMFIPNSSINLAIHMACVLVDDAAIYFSSAINKVTIGCFLLLQETKFPPKKKSYPEVIFQSSKLPTQSASVYATTFESLAVV